jgi:hypothetical protein
VVKERRKGRVISVTQRLVYGSLEIVERIMAQSVGQVINTAFMERLNLSIRQHVSALGRKVLAIAKGEVGLNDFLALYQAYYNFCLPHSSLRQPLPRPLPTKGSGSCKKYGRVFVLGQPDSAVASSFVGANDADYRTGSTKSFLST